MAPDKGLSGAKKQTAASFLFLENTVRHIKAVSRRLGKGTGKSSPISKGINTFTTVHLKIFAFWTGGIVLTFNAVKQGIIIGSTRGYLI